MQQQSPLVWIDLEMTGLNIEKEQIIEIAAIVTDSNLNILAQMNDSIVIHCSDDLLNAMDDWNRTHHGESGLTERVRNSKISLAQAEQMVIDFLVENAVVDLANNDNISARPLIAGNSVYVDRQFISKQMPTLNQLFHYRIVDVSGIKELCRRWYPTQFASQPPKKNVHRALDDIIESIEELKYYRHNIFK